VARREPDEAPQLRSLHLPFEHVHGDRDDEVPERVRILQRVHAAEQAQEHLLDEVGEIDARAERPLEDAVHERSVPADDLARGICPARRFQQRDDGGVAAVRELAAADDAQVSSARRAQHDGLRPTSVEDFTQ
jgi:hypothetical protein